MRNLLKIFVFSLIFVIIIMFLMGLRVYSLMIAPFALLVMGLYILLQRSLPQITDVAKTMGIHGTIDIIRDSDAIPHIFAEHKMDVFFGLGYVHAQDRLWQMEFQRRIGHGRLSEVLGPRSVSFDRFLRTLGAHRAAAKVWPMLPDEIKEIITAYIAGINAVISNCRGGRRPPEFQILGFTPEPWTGIDVLVWIKMMAWNLDLDMWTELLRKDIVAEVGLEQAALLFPSYAAAEALRMPPSTQEDDSDQLSGLGKQVRALMGHQGLSSSGIGSNCWVVDGTLSASGKPLIANDIHLGTGMPAIWYLAHLSAGDFDVVGATIPGLPAVTIGRNRHIAWGITNLHADVQDLYYERVSATGGTVEFQDTIEPLEVINEPIKVKRQDAIPYQVRVTRHGPLISDVLNANNAELPPDQRGDSLDPIALRWSALDPNDTTVEAFLRLNEARDWNQFQQALQLVVAPALTFFYADGVGNIGYQAAGRIPLRSGSDGALPAEGWSGTQEWVGWIPFEDLPHAYNPPEHYVFSANHCPVSDAYPYFIGREWAPPYRAQRIVELLQAKQTFSLADFTAMQSDTISLQARETLPIMLTLVNPKNEAQRSALEVLAKWNYDMSGDSVAATIFAMWFIVLMRFMVSKTVSAKLSARYAPWFDFSSGFLRHILLHHQHIDQGNSAVEPQVSDVTNAEQLLQEAAQQTLQETLDLLRARLGTRQEDWRWSRLHTIPFRHQPFDGSRLLRRFFNRSTPSSGDWNTINGGEYAIDRPFEQNIIPGYRQVIDLSSLQGGQFIHATGQSGHFFSPAYDDYLSDWQRVCYRSIRFDRQEVEADRTTALRLETS